MNHTRFPKENHLPTWARRDNHVRKGWSCTTRCTRYQDTTMYNFTYWLTHNYFTCTLPDDQPVGTQTCWSLWPALFCDMRQRTLNWTFRGPCIASIFLLIYFQQDAALDSLFISGKMLYMFDMFRVVSPPIIRSTYNCIYSIWYLSNRYCYLPLLWKSWNWFECGVGIVFIRFGVVADATAPKQINTIPTLHSNQIHKSGR